MATTTTTTEQLPAYSANAQPGFTPANGGDDALLPQYTFPTKFKIGAFFTDGLLVNIEQIKGHLALLHAFSNLKVEVENLPSGSIVNMPGNREQRWAWFVGLAAERFDKWARSLQSKDALQPLEDTLPPLDVLMVWHSYMLNPRWYTEDGQRILACKALVELGQVLSKELSRLPALLDASPSEARVTMFYTRVGHPFDPFQAASVNLTKTIKCPKCRDSIDVPYMNIHGSGYLQANFLIACRRSDCPLITKETLCARKLAENLSRQGMAPDSYLPGTFFTESRVADQKAGMDILASIRKKYKSTTKGQQSASTVNEDLCIAILEGANFKLEEIRGHIGRSKLLGRIMSAHSTPMIYSVELAGAVLRQGSFVQKMAHLEWTKPGFFDHPDDEIVLQHAIARYHAFLDLMSSSPASFFVPTLDIDLVWHTHQLMSAKYEADCKQYIWRFIDHDDKVDGIKLSSAFDLTCRAWKDRFSTPYTHCGCPLPGDTIGQRLSRFLSSSSSSSSDDSSKTPSQLAPPGTRQDMLAATHASEHNAVVFTSRNAKALELAKTKHREHARRMERRVERERAKDLKEIEKGLSKEERERRQRERERDPYYCGYGAPFIMPVPLYYGGGYAGLSPSTAVDVPQPIATGEQLDIKGLITLCALRFSSAWGERSSAFATYLFLVIIFPSTLVPASVFGFCSTAAGIVFSNWAGGLVDKHGRLYIVRWTTTAQKLATAAIYSLLFVLLLVPAARQPGSAALISSMAIIVLCGCVEKVSTVCLAVSIEREWPSTISQGSSEKLTTMNTWLRRTDLVCDLIAPLFVSGLSAGVSYHFAAAFLTGMTVLCLGLEIFLCGVTHKVFPQLHHQNNIPVDSESEYQQDQPSANPRTFLTIFKDVYDGLSAFMRDIVEFSRLPVFYTSLSIASIYLTVLSFDGTMLTYLKNSLNYGDPFLAGQKAVSTVAGLLGTILFPFVMHKIGLVRTGSWSIW
ncbi:hypothetical protein MD484_g7831, partial [Candolleomyces efflorescens]